MPLVHADIVCEYIVPEVPAQFFHGLAAANKTAVDEKKGAGYLVVGRFIDAGMIDVLSETTNISSGMVNIKFPGDDTGLDGG